MDEPVISIFNKKYYFRAITGAVLLLWATGYLVYHSLLRDFQNPGQFYMITALFIAADCVYYYFFSKSWKRITVNPTEIVVYDVVFKKQFTIPYAGITRIGAYRARRTNLTGYAFSQDFVIECSDGRYLGFSEGWYGNYDRLTMAIYYHTYGPGHGRERYLERRAGRQ